MKFSASNKNYDFDMRQAADFISLGLDDIPGVYIYLVHANQEKSIEAEIDIYLSLSEKSRDRLDRKQIIASFRKVCRSGLMKVLHSSNWKQHKVLIHPLKKVLNQKEKENEQK